MSVDPLAEATVTMSPYTAMNDDPANFIDPLGLQSYNLQHKPSNINVSPFPMALVDYGTTNGAGKNMIHNTPANAPGGIAGWFSDVSMSLMNDAMGAMHAQGQTGIGAGMTGQEVEAAGWIIDRDNGNSFSVHKWDANLNRVEGNIVSTSGQLTWTPIGNYGGIASAWDQNLKTVYSSGLYIPKAAISVLGTKAGQMMDDGLGWSF